MSRLALVLALAVVAPALAPVEATAAPEPAPKKAKKKPKKAKQPRPAKKPAPKPAPEPEPEIEMESDPIAPPPAPAVDAERPLPEPVPTPVASTPAKPERVSWRRIYVRAGGAFIKPLAVSRELELADIDGAASLAVENGPIAGSGATVSSAAAFAMTVGHRLRPRLSVEILLGVPFTVKFKGTGTLATDSIAPMALGIPTGVPALGEDLGEAKAAPPVVTAVYDLVGRGRVRPYVGGGVSVLFAFDEQVTNPILTEVGEPEMSVAPAPGLVVQTGLDMRLASRIYARLDVKFIAFMLARAQVKHIQVRTPELPVFDTVEVGTAKMNVWVNPLTVQLGVGTDF